MVKALRRFAVRYFLSLPVPVVLFVLAGISYGILIPGLGYYGDDWSMSWLAYRSHQLGTFFAENRPQWGFYFEILSRFIGPAPWQWQIFTVVWHWLNAVAFWRLLDVIWPFKKEMAAAAAILFLLYPGFLLSSVAMTVSIHFVQLTIFLCSLLATLYSLRRPAQSLRWTILALLGAFLNLAISEYWFFLELIRPMMIFYEAARQEPDPRKRIQRALLRALPFLGLFAGFLLARAFDIGGINAGHSIAFVDAFRQEPLSALFDLISRIPRDLWVTTLGSFGHLFSLPGLRGRSLPVTMLLLGMLLAAAVFSFLWLRRQRSASAEPFPKGLNRTGLGYLLAGLVCLLLAGWPIWFAYLDFSLADLTSTRLALPFMAGACLFVVGLAKIIAIRPWLSTAIYAVTIGFGVVFQLLMGLTFTRQMEITESLLWQFAMRMPSLQPGTLFLARMQGPELSGENAFSAMLNWMYVPGDDADQELHYFMYQNGDHMEEALDRMKMNDHRAQQHMIGSFSEQNLVAVEFSSTTCLRVLDPDLDTYNPSLLPQLRQAARKTNYVVMQPASAGAVLPRPPVEIFGNTTPPENWCAAFEKASLAAQAGDWARVAELGSQAFSRGFSPTNAMELVVFIEGYAHQNDWQRSTELLELAFKLDPSLPNLICHIRQRLPLDPQPSIDQQIFLDRMQCQR